jgi:hypothetical protein
LILLGFVSVTHGAAQRHRGSPVHCIGANILVITELFPDDAVQHDNCRKKELPVLCPCSWVK